MVPFHPMQPMELPALSFHSCPVLRGSRVRVNGVFVLNSGQAADALAGGEEAQIVFPIGRYRKTWIELAMDEQARAPAEE